MNLNTNEITLDGRVRGSVSAESSGKNQAESQTAIKSTDDKNQTETPQSAGEQKSESSDKTEKTENPAANEIATPKPQ